MAIVHIAVLSVALSALLILRCAGVLDDQRGRRSRLTIRSRRELRSLRRLDRALQTHDPVTPSGAPSIEQLAYDLRRLARQRHTGPTRCSEVWLAAVLSAYDARLQLACRRLGVPERLQPLEGVDRERERLRVEDRLQAAGLSLRPGPY
ncbi:hypothetical protein [Actinoplanes sp. DH11]|uniref:hypothetical protein n=1 Tax=Actinoplanes sp. DH11 TaxID=2857011 RepID=UPI001E36B274|nr:hypothetical protein [Actinoplanes sp. DH11]